MRIMSYDAFEKKAYINANLASIIGDVSSVFDEIIFRYVSESDNKDRIAVIDIGEDNYVNYAKYGDRVTLKSTQTISVPRINKKIEELGYEVSPITIQNGEYKILYLELPFSHIVVLENNEGGYHAVSVNNINCTNKMRFSKFLKKFTPLSDKTIEMLSDNFKNLNYDLLNNDSDYKFVHSKGEELREKFNTENILTSGILQIACMNDKLDFLDLYVKNDNISVLTMEKDGVIVSRRLLFKRKDGKIFANVNYYSTQKADILMKKYCESKGYVTDFKSSVQLNDVSMDEFPYVDVYTYLDLETNTLYSNTDNLTEYLILNRTDGEYIEVNTNDPESLMPYIKESKELEYEDQLLYNHGEQEIHTMNLTIDGEVVAYVRYHVLRGKVFIDMIESHIKGQGYGKMLMRKLAKTYGYDNIERRDLTEDGLKMREVLDKEFNYTPDKPLTIDIIETFKSDNVKEYIKYVCLFGFSEKEESNLLSRESDLDINELNTICEYIQYSFVWNNEKNVPENIVKIINKYV